VLIFKCFGRKLHFRRKLSKSWFTNFKVQSEAVVFLKQENVFMLKQPSFSAKVTLNFNERPKA
jgi:hypothetical protein